MRSSTSYLRFSTQAVIETWRLALVIQYTLVGFHKVLNLACESIKMSADSNELLVLPNYLNRVVVKLIDSESLLSDFVDGEGG